MKITVGQLKQLIREQIEEAYMLDGKDITLIDTEKLETYLQYKPTQEEKLAIEGELKRREDKNFWQQRGAEKAAEAQRQDAYSQKKSFDNKVGGHAPKLQKLFSPPTQPGEASPVLQDIANNGMNSSFLKNYTKGTLGAEIWDKKNNTWQPALLKAAANIQITQGPLKGQDLETVLNYVASNDLDKLLPGAVGRGVEKVRSFLPKWAGGLKELRQLVREEVARELRRRG